MFYVTDKSYKALQKTFIKKFFIFSEKLFGKQPFENHVKLSWFLKMFLENFF